MSIEPSRATRSSMSSLEVMLAVILALAQTVACEVHEVKVDGMHVSLVIL